MPNGNVAWYAPSVLLILTTTKASEARAEPISAFTQSAIAMVARGGRVTTFGQSPHLAC